jgi:hypothetical protein
MPALLPGQSASLLCQQPTHPTEELIRKLNCTVLSLQLPPGRRLSRLHHLPQGQGLRERRRAAQRAAQPRAWRESHLRPRRLSDHRRHRVAGLPGQTAHGPCRHPVRQRGRHVGGGL